MSCKLKKPVRVIRGHRLTGSDWAPAEGTAGNGGKAGFLFVYFDLRGKISSTGMAGASPYISVVALASSNPPDTKEKKKNIGCR
ncbi:hypothetical protein CVT25_010820 [Psilocybe cyanescens]|uniref:Uncharacterized protein n=1 Tax=Psilocybe cyanescens TaxID=93625 RepID=A0A409WF53_PSICY|nr:hypothetical protein CVT25_010820 [Psilocybe cyanescens]